MDALNVARVKCDDLFNAAPVGFVTISEKGVIIKANTAAAEILRTDRNSLINQQMIRFIPKEDHDVYHQHREKVLKASEPQEFELRVAEQSERTLWVHMTSTFIQGDASSIANCMVMIDISRYKVVEKRLLESETKYRTVADFTYDWEYWVAPDGSYPYISPSCERITGYRPEDFRQDPMLLQRIIHPEDREKVAEHFVNEYSLTDSSADHLDFRLISRTGKEIWISHECQAVFGSDRRYLGRRGSNRDISRQKQSEKEMAILEAKNRQLQKAESLGRMAGAVAHHFNNLLMVVIGNLDFAMESPSESRYLIKSVAEAANAARKASDLSKWMLTYLGHTIETQMITDLTVVCRQNLPVIQKAIPDSNYIETDLPDPGPLVRGNRKQLRQVLTDLVINASEAIPNEQGRISLNVRTVSGGGIPLLHRYPIEWQPDDITYACLEVGDSGCGIASDDIEKIFDPFFTTKFTGRGLGLPSVLGILRAHHGAIAVDSCLGKGSIFRVFLPVSTC